MAFEFKLPDIGEGLVEGEIVRWLVKVGDTVREDQPIVEVMTDKATVEITSPRAGVIQDLRVGEGQIAKVHSTIVVINESGGGKTAAAPTTVHAAPKAAPAEVRSAPTTKTTTVNPDGPIRLTPRPASDGPLILPPIPSHRVLAAPAVRRLAIQSGIDLNSLRGSGPYGRVMRSDVEQAKPNGNVTMPSSKTSQPVGVHGHYITRGGAVEELPLKGLRKRIATQMVKSKQTAPHFTYVEEIDMTPVVELRKELKAEMQKRGTTLTFLPFIFKSLIPALKKFPQVNASLDDERGVIIHKQYYNIGISVATDDGLTVAVVKGVDKLDVWQIGSELARLSTAARERKIRSEELQDSTFTVTSMGNIGGVLATPIINHPEVGIMGIFKIRETPVVRDGKIVVRHMMYVSTSFDHRVVDGDVAGHFTNEFLKHLDNPKLLLNS